MRSIVAYDEEGFWIQNSYGKRWGRAGFGYLRYDDWLKNGTDVWVARLGVPTRLASATSTAQITASVGASPQSQTIRAPAAAPRSAFTAMADSCPMTPTAPRSTTWTPSSRADDTSAHRLEVRAATSPALGDFLTVTHGWKKKRLLAVRRR